LDAFLLAFETVWPTAIALVAKLTTCPALLGSLGLQLSLVGVAHIHERLLWISDSPATAQYCAMGGQEIGITASSLNDGIRARTEELPIIATSPNWV
jgi:hypothetical protein